PGPEACTQEGFRKVIPGHRVAIGLGICLLVLAGTQTSGRGLRAAAATPSSQSFTVPTAGNSVTLTWSGSIPPGTHPTSSCGAIPGDLTLDSTAFVVSVPSGLYTTATAIFAFSITWTPASGNETTNDEVLTLVGPSGEIASSDGSTTTEAVAPKNLAAATYSAEACGFANTTLQPYTGKLTITTTTNPPPPPPPTPVTDPITFGVPTVMDPIHPFGEPNVGVDAAGHVYSSGPAGTGTQRSFWEASVGGGATVRPDPETDH